MGDINDPPSRQRMRTLLRLVMLVALYAVPILTAVRPIAEPVLDPDLWWHLRAGQWICEHRAVPVNDPFSQYGQDKPWVAYSWLFEVMLFGLYSCLGLAGAIVYRALLSLAVTAALHRLVARREPRFLVAVALTGIGLLAVSVLFDERPWLFTILFTILTLDVVLDLRDGRPNGLLWLLPAVYALWANLHIQYVYGLAVLALACVAPAVDRLLDRKEPGESAASLGSVGWRRLLLLTNLCLLATLLNPYHIRIYFVVVEYAAQPGPFNLINELKALEFRGPYDWVTLALALAGAYALGRRKSASSFDFLLLAGSSFCAFRERRDLWFVVAASLAILASGPKAPVRDAQRFHWTPLLRVIWAAALAALAAFMVWRTDLSEERLQRTVAERFPAGAADFVLKQGFSGPIYNHLNWGGYLIWRWP
ncbi:MAG TPA: hypothetical protein VMS17_29105, partial [Gemmataceae bacterium]|nr:hypothetical protein [Gemmataceae bacterium]